ncbi:MAG: hypothetical protein RLZZ324_562 [Candidatus Parcubacteria bacterium]|jgi:NAD+ kinase
MTKDIAVYGGSFNVAGSHHRHIAMELSDVKPEFTQHGAPRFDFTLAVPCGPRPDKVSVNDTLPIFRAITCDLTFAGVPRTVPDLFDLEQSSFTTTIGLDERYKRAHPDGNVWHVIGADMVQHGAVGKAAIQQWEGGERLWRDLRWAVVTREGYPLAPGDLPPGAKIVAHGTDGASSTIRHLRYAGKPFAHLVTPQVAAFIERYDLYRGGQPVSTALLQAQTPKVILVIDELNPKAVAIAERFRAFEVADPADANMILVIGGDGMIHKAVQAHWRLRLPFVGINAGRRGYLLNDPEQMTPERLYGPLHAHLHTLLYGEVTDVTGASTQHYAFNDMCMKAQSLGGAAHIQVSVNGDVKYDRLVGDACLVCTPGGSTAYARHMGVSPVRPDARSVFLTGLAIEEPEPFRPANLPFGATIDMAALDTDKRPVGVCMDNSRVLNARTLRVRTSNIGAVELAFLPERDMMAKFDERQFAGGRTR